MDCPFCDMSGEENRILEQDDLTMVFLSNMRRMRGHTLVVPKRHIEKPWELTDQEWTRIGQLLRKYQQLIVKRLGVGCDLDQRYRPWVKPFALGKQNHLHFHLLPRSAGDVVEERITPIEREFWGELSPKEAAEVKAILLQ